MGRGRGRDSALMMGAFVGNKDFVAAHPDGIRTFLQEYEASIERANAVRDETAKLCKKYAIIEDETVAERSHCRLQSGVYRRR